MLPPGSERVAHDGDRDAGRLPARHRAARAPRRATQLEEAFTDARVTPNIAVVTSQREAILPLVLAGAGATLFPRPLAEQAAPPRRAWSSGSAPTSPAPCTSSTAADRSHRRRPRSWSSRVG